MPTIPDWLTPPNYLAAAEAGARIGQSQSQFAAEQLLKQQELAANTGLGYARINAEQASAAAARKQAEARLALQQGRYSDLNELGHERLNDTETQRTAANDLKSQALDLQKQKFGMSSDQRQQALDLETQRIESMGGGKAQARQQAEISTDAAIKALADPDWQTNPVSVLQKYPAAANHAIIKNDLANRNMISREQNKPLPPAQVTSFQGANEIKYPVPAAQALQAMGTNALGAGRAAPGAAAPAAAPARQQFQVGQQVNQNGHIYEFDGQKWNPVQ